MHNRRRLCFLCLLICISLLACDTTTMQPLIDQFFPHIPTAPVQVESVTVLPAYGSGTFNATVKYSYEDGDGIHCYVDTGNHDSENVFTHALQGSSGPVVETFAFDFTKPGPHTLKCTGYSGRSSASDTFTVTTGPDLSATQPPVGQPLSPEHFKTATLFYLSYINQTAPGMSGPPYWCFTGDVSGGSPIPPLSVAPDGTLTGQCKGSFKLPGGAQVSYSGTTNGHWDPQTGNVTWEMDMTIQQTYDSYSSTRIIKIHESSPSPITTASDGVVGMQGKAEWSDSCHSSAAVGPVCTKDATSYNWSGTLNWKMTFNP